jgi:hypothetical protein
MAMPVTPRTTQKTTAGRAPMLPVTVARFLVRSMTPSMSRSSTLLSTHADAITSVVPTTRAANSQRSTCPRLASRNPAAAVSTLP